MIQVCPKCGGNSWVWQVIDGQHSLLCRSCCRFVHLVVRQERVDWNPSWVASATACVYATIHPGGPSSA
jgi:hypothetical protein